MLLCKSVRRYFCESFFWAFESRQAAKVTWQLIPTAPRFALRTSQIRHVIASPVTFLQMV